MLYKLLSMLRFQPGNDDMQSQRRYERRACDVCVSVIDGKTYPVENWSMGGLLIFADGRTFAGDDRDVTLKFKLQDRMLEVAHKARIVRKNYDHIAFEFLPLTESVKKTFQNVIDDYVSGEFADSQLI